MDGSPFPTLGLCLMSYIYKLFQKEKSRWLGESHTCVCTSLFFFYTGDLCTLVNPTERGSQNHTTPIRLLNYISQHPRAQPLFRDKENLQEKCDAIIKEAWDHAVNNKVPGDMSLAYLIL